MFALEKAAATELLFLFSPPHMNSQGKGKGLLHV
jgi:hypothetical protein